MTATHAYVSRRPCGHPVSLMVDIPDDPRGTAKFVAAEIRAGHTVERVTIEEARVIGVVYCACVPAKKPAQRTKKDPQMFTPGALAPLTRRGRR